MKTFIVPLALFVLIGCQTTPRKKLPVPPPSDRPVAIAPKSFVAQRLASATPFTAASGPVLTVAQPQEPLVFAAYWPTPIEPGWVPQWSTNMTQWTDATSTVVYTSGPGLPWTGKFFVRLVKRP
jgi:hypothetical protein